MSEKKITLSVEDKHRAQRLNEEVLARLEELTLILARNLDRSGVRFGNTTVRAPGAAVDASARKIEYFFDSDGNCIGKYDYDGGTCGPC